MHNKIAYYQNHLPIKNTCMIKLHIIKHAILIHIDYHDYHIHHKEKYVQEIKTHYNNQIHVLQFSKSKLIAKHYEKFFLKKRSLHFVIKPRNSNEKLSKPIKQMTKD